MQSNYVNTTIFGGGNERSLAGAGLFVKAASCPHGHDAAFVFVPSRTQVRTNHITLFYMDKNKLPYVSPEVETVEIIPESSVLSGSIDPPFVEDPWF